MFRRLNVPNQISGASYGNVHLSSQCNESKAEIQMLKSEIQKLKDEIKELLADKRAGSLRRGENSEEERKEVKEVSFFGQKVLEVHPNQYKLLFLGADPTLLSNMYDGDSNNFIYCHSFYVL